MDSLTKERLSKAVLVFAIVLIAYVGILALAKLREYPYIGSNYPSGNVITVDGTGEVFAVPDLAEIGFSVNSEKPTLAAAQEDAATRMNAVIAYLKEQGVNEKDIKTTNYSANPKYECDTVRMMNVDSAESVTYPYPQPCNQVANGYTVYQSVSVKVRDTDQAGTLVKGVGELGVTDIYGPNFTVDDETELKREARQKAIEDARAKARQLADDLGVRLVRVVSFSENGGGYYPMYGKAVMMDAVAPEANIAPELPTGENTITSYVNITYEIR
jgi:uncharacterized protein